MNVGRYLKVLLIISVTAILTLLLVNGLVSLIPQAEAKTTTTQPYYDVELVKQIYAPALQEIVVLGDQKTFILRFKDTVSVFQVKYVEAK